MNKQEEVDLYKYSTMRTHSVAAVMYTPENITELKEAIIECSYDCYLLGAGSNVVFATKVEKPIINLMNLNNSIVLNDDRTVTVGCSTRIQKLINFGKENSLGGFEYLYSLPASVGGVVYMNAGRGKGSNLDISQWIKNIEYLDLSDLEIKVMNIDRKDWRYRHSPFQEMNAVILSTTFRMKECSSVEIEELINKRKELVRRNQEGDKPSCGSVFFNSNKYIMKFLKGKRIGGARFSKKTTNWITNDKNGSSEDVISLIQYAQRIHKFLGQRCSPEIRIFR